LCVIHGRGPQFLHSDRHRRDAGPGVRPVHDGQHGDSPQQPTPPGSVLFLAKLQSSLLGGMASVFGKCNAGHNYSVFVSRYRAVSNPDFQPNSGECLFRAPMETIGFSLLHFTVAVVAVKSSWRSPILTITYRTHPVYRDGILRPPDEVSPTSSTMGTVPSASSRCGSPRGGPAWRPPMVRASATTQFTITL